MEMTLRLIRGHRWGDLIDQLAEGLAAELRDPFATARVIVPSAPLGRLVGQALASRQGVSAGVSFVSPQALMRELALASGADRDRTRWAGTALTLAVADALHDVAPQHPLLERSLRADEDRPGRRLATAARLARLFRTYLDSSPGLVAQWMDGSDEGLDGEPLPKRLAWEPDLLRSAIDHLEVDPIDLLDQMEGAALADATPTWILAVDSLTVPQERMVRALATSVGVTALHPTGSTGAEWASALATSVTDLPGGPAPLPHMEIHDSHGPARQVEVLRDELSRAFSADPTLEPRDVVIVTPDPRRYASLLDAAFAPLSAAVHPGRTLRVQPIGAAASNPVLELGVDLLRLPDTRATASDLLNLLLRPPVAHRWRLDDRLALTEIVAGAGVRWGLDGAHRDAFGLGDLRQNTWLRGIDRLLVALASAPGDDIGLDLSGAESVTSSDLTLVGSLCELLSRLRRFVAEVDTSATIAQWAARTRQVLAELVGLPRADEWQLWQAQTVLARLEAENPGRVVSRAEFTMLLSEAIEPFRARVAAGNGNLQVLPLGELQHVEHRAVAFIGVTDDLVPGRRRLPADCIDLGGALPDQAALRLTHLATHARNAERVIVVRQARSSRTNDRTAEPVAISWLIDHLGLQPTVVEHPPSASSTASFGTRPSFDRPAYEGAEARSLPLEPAFHTTNRHEARTRPVGSAQTRATLTSLATFLTDPARAFLRGPGGISLYDEPRVTDEISLVTDGLVHWGVVDELVSSLKTGRALREVEQHVSRREQLPPGAIGLASFERAKQETVSLWSGAADDWAAEVSDHPINLTIALPLIGEDVTITGSVRTRGGAVVEITPSKGLDKLIAPWVDALALTASGTPTRVRLHQLKKEYGSTFGEARCVEPLDQDKAIEQLGRLLLAHHLGQHRLVLAPAAPAIEYARQADHGRFVASKWRGAVGDWRTPFWPNVSRAWAQFFKDDLSELFTDEFVDTDPRAGASPFESWAVTLYGPLVRSIR